MKRTTGVWSIAVAFTMMAVCALPASAKTITLHYFSKQIGSSFTDANGHPLPPNAPPAVGDRFGFASNEYAGNHKHHAKTASASVHVDCVVNSPSTAVCDGQFALGGSMLLANNFTIHFSNTPASKVKITGGTNRFRAAHGTIITKGVGNTDNSDDTIKFTP